MSFRIAVMQPYLLPYISYFALIGKVDEFVFFDTAQYLRRGWINRNRIAANNAEGWSYISVPVEKSPQETAIRDIRIFNDGIWPEKLRKTIEQTYSKAPHFYTSMNLLKPLWESNSNLSSLLEKLTKNFAEHLALHPRWIRSSEIEASNSELKSLHYEDRVISYCKIQGAKTYWNASGGTDLYHPDSFRKQGLEIQFIKPLDLEAAQARFPKLTALSILDVTMWYSASDCREILKWVS